MSSQTEADSNKISKQVVVIKPHQKFDIVFDSPGRTINEIIDSTKEGFYSVLHRNEKSLDFTKLTNRYKLRIDGLINKIVLKNFPNKGTYYLQVCGSNVTTAKLLDGELTFDFDKKKRSNMLSAFITSAIGPNEENIENRFSYLRTGRVECDILTPEPLTEPYLVELEGLFYNENKWEKRITEYKIYPNEQELYYSPTVYMNILKELDFYGEESFEISLRVNEHLYGPFISKPHDRFKNLIKFKFSGWEEICSCSQNKYLSIDNNKQVINTGIINNFSIISSVGNLTCAKYSYVLNNLEYCSTVFM